MAQDKSGSAHIRHVQQPIFKHCCPRRRECAHEFQALNSERRYMPGHTQPAGKRLPKWSLDAGHPRPGTIRRGQRMLVILIFHEIRHVHNIGCSNIPILPDKRIHPSEIVTSRGSGIGLLCRIFPACNTWQSGIRLSGMQRNGSSFACLIALLACLPAIYAAAEPALMNAPRVVRFADRQA